MPQAHPQEKNTKKRPTDGATAYASHDSKPRHDEEAAHHGSKPRHAQEARHPALDVLKDKLEQLTKKTRMEHIAKVVAKRARITKELRTIPARMQKVTNQAQLVLELVDDFRDGKYRKVSWYAIAIAAASLLYAVSPGDVVPDYVPGLGALDDVLVLGVALRLIKRDLRAYCQFKGYDPEKYF